MKKLSLYATATSFFVAVACTAHARSAYDGSWDLAFVTQRGACDPAYNFTVNVSNGVLTHPNLLKFRGYVARSGAVRAAPLAAGHGAATQEMRDARATGPRNEIDSSTRRRTGVFEPEAQVACFRTNLL